MNEQQMRAERLVRRLSDPKTPTERLTDALGKKANRRDTERKRQERRLADQQPGKGQR